MSVALSDEVIHRASIGLRMFDRAKRQKEREQMFGELTRQEARIMRMVALRKSAEDICDALRISPHTLKAHRASIKKKAGVYRPIDVAAYCMRIGAIEPEEFMLASDDDWKVAG